MSTEEPWEPWAQAMRSAQIGDPRNGRPSWTQLARRAHVSTSTVTNAVNGKTKTGPETIQALAKALRIKPEVVSGWLGVPSVSGPYEPPAEGALLLSHEREAIDQLIRAIARGREDVKDDGRPPMTPAGDDPAPKPPRRISSTSRVRGEAAERSQAAPTPQRPQGRGRRSPA